MKYIVEIKSDKHPDARWVKCYCFFERDFFCTPTNNGKGASSVWSTYKDGFNGVLYDKLLSREVTIKKTEIIVENSPDGYKPFLEVII